jgi:hypothetical protein
MKKQLFALIIFISFGFTLFPKEKYLLEVETKEYSLKVIDHIKGKKSIKINFVAKCDMRIPLWYEYKINGKNFFIQNDICPRIYLGWDYSGATMETEVNSKLINKGTRISQTIELMKIDKITGFSFHISYISNPVYIYNEQMEQTASMFERLMNFSEFKIYLK